MKNLTADGSGGYSHPVPSNQRLGIHGVVEPGSYKAMVGKHVTVYLGENGIRHTIRQGAQALRSLEFMEAFGQTLGYETREQARLRDAAMLREVANMIEAGDLG